MRHWKNDIKSILQVVITFLIIASVVRIVGWIINQLLN